MNRRLDEVLESEALVPPSGFTLGVLQRIAELPKAPPVRNGPAWLPWAAVLCGIALGIGDLVSFIFSVWIAVPAY